MSVTVEQVKVYHCTLGRYRKAFRVGDEKVTVTTYCGGDQYHETTLTLAQARSFWAELQRKGWLEF